MRDGNTLGVGISVDSSYAASRDALLERVQPGPYARVGFTTYYAINLAWNADLANPVLSSPSRPALEQLLTRLSSDGLVYHVSAMLGMSRFYWTYSAAKEADRRNAQWYSDNLVLRAGQPERKTPANAWVTPSRGGAAMVETRVSNRTGTCLSCGWDFVENPVDRGDGAAGGYLCRWCLEWTAGPLREEAVAKVAEFLTKNAGMSPEEARTDAERLLAQPACA